MQSETSRRRVRVFAGAVRNVRKTDKKGSKFGLVLSIPRSTAAERCEQDLQEKEKRGNGGEKVSLSRKEEHLAILTRGCALGKGFGRDGNELGTFLRQM
jgi:hypothetical protein